MGGLFGGGGKTETVKEPRVQRLPTEDDPSVQAAASRTKKAALSRSGRQSTLLTDSTLGSNQSTDNTTSSYN